MTKFALARLRLTIWYISIVAIVSFTFSAIIYNGVVADLERGFQMAEFHIRNPNGVFIPKSIALQILNDDFEAAKKSVVLRLLRMNGIIILASGVAAYVLAGKTIKPIEEALEEQKRFTADAGHELKTPLTAMRTELEVTLRGKKLNLKDAKTILKSNLEEVISLQKLSENLMLLNRYSKNHNGMHFNRLNSKNMIQKAIKKLSPIAEEKQIKIDSTLVDLDLNADSQSLEELFVILLDNAIKYSPKNSRVLIENKSVRRKIMVTVRDNGHGISKEDQEHLFDRFYRSDDSRNKSAQTDGYGLGLTIAKEIVERHKGEISVKSELGKGSTFRVIFHV